MRQVSMIAIHRKVYEKRYTRIQKMLLVPGSILLVILVMDILCSCTIGGVASDTASTRWRPAFLVPGKLPQKNVDAAFMAMDSGQKIGQCMIVHLRWVAKGETGFTLDDAQRAELRALQPGGVTLYAQNLGTIAQTQSLIRDIRDQCRIPPFIAIDEEGGRVSRLKTSSGIKATVIAPAATLAASGNAAVALAYDTIGRELSALGFNMDFAPVADLGFAESDGIIGDRSFGKNPQSVASLVGVAISGLESAGVISVIKHYPGHGRSSGDSHFGRQIVKADWPTLKSSDLIPFMAAIKSGVGGMMTAHIEYPLIDPSAVPVSMSPVLLKEKLRKELGFSGLVITDALDMQGVLTAGSPDEIALRSLNAGVDLLLSPDGPLRLKNFLLQAIKEKNLDPAVIDTASKRILQIKNQYGILGRGAGAYPFMMVSQMVGPSRQP